MLTTVDRYITGHAIRSILVVLGSLLALLTLFALFEELNEDKATYGLKEALTYVLQTMPRRLDEILVYGLFLGHLIALGRLAETNELTVFRVTGMSPTRLIMALVPSLLVWLVLSISLSEFIAPQSERRAEAAKEKALYADRQNARKTALWVRTDNMFMQVREIDENGAIFGITQYWLNEQNELVETVQAEQGRYDEEIEQWQLLNGSTSRITSSLENVSSSAQTFQARTWNNSITPEVLASQAFLDASKMSFIDLRRQIAFGQSQQHGTSEYELAFWSRILKPLTYLGLTLLALGVVMGSQRDVGVGQRITVGIFAGLGFKYLQDLLAPAAIVFDIPAPIAVLIPIATYWFVAIYLVRRNA